MTRCYDLILKCLKVHNCSSKSFLHVCTYILGMGFDFFTERKSSNVLSFGFLEFKNKDRCQLMTAGQATSFLLAIAWMAA